jgi:hypothetical protein
VDAEGARLSAARRLCLGWAGTFSAAVPHGTVIFSGTCLQREDDKGPASRVIHLLMGLSVYPTNGYLTVANTAPALYISPYLSSGEMRDYGFHYVARQPHSTEVHPPP